MTLIINMNPIDICLNSVRNFVCIKTMPQKEKV